MPDPHLPKIMAAFTQAMSHLDETEPQIRDLIERRLFTVAGTKVKGAKKIADQLAKEIAAIRIASIKKSFRHLRDNLPSDNGL